MSMMVDTSQREKRTLKRLFGFLGFGWVVAGIALAFGMTLCSASVAKADNIPSIHTLFSYLESHLNLGEDEIIRSLLQYGVGRDTTTEPRLVRWSIPSLKIAILTTGDARDDVRTFIQRMNATATTIDKHVAYCVQPMSVAPDGSYAPDLDSVDCLHQTTDVTLLIDNSTIPSHSLYRDLRRRSTIPEEGRFWEARENADPAHFKKTGCEERVKKGLESSELSSATAYLRIVERSSDYRSCMRALPFLIFGQLPIAGPNGEEKLVPEMLELLYAPELHPGMRQSEIKALLGS